MAAAALGRAGGGHGEAVGAVAVGGRTRCSPMPTAIHAGRSPSKTRHPHIHPPPAPPAPAPAARAGPRPNRLRPSARVAALPPKQVPPGRGLRLGRRHCHSPCHHGSRRSRPRAGRSRGSRVHPRLRRRPRLPADQSRSPPRSPPRRPPARTGCGGRPPPATAPQRRACQSPDWGCAPAGVGRCWLRAEAGAAAVVARPLSGGAGFVGAAALGPVRFGAPAVRAAARRSDAARPQRTRDERRPGRCERRGGAGIGGAVSDGLIPDALEPRTRHLAAQRTVSCPPTRARSRPQSPPPCAQTRMPPLWREADLPRAAPAHRTRGGHGRRTGRPRPRHCCCRHRRHPALPAPPKPPAAGPPSVRLRAQSCAVPTVRDTGARVGATDCRQR